MHDVFAIESRLNLGAGSHKWGLIGKQVCRRLGGLLLGSSLPPTLARSLLEGLCRRKVGYYPRRIAIQDDEDLIVFLIRRTFEAIPVLIELAESFDTVGANPRYEKPITLDEARSNPTLLSGILSSPDLFQFGSLTRSLVVWLWHLLSSIRGS